MVTQGGNISNIPLFVVFEGADGVGKSTQIKHVEKELTRLGYKTVVSREPGGTPLGETIRAIVKENFDLYPWSEFYLIQGARIEHIGKVIEPALRKGYIVLVDRFTPSSLVYQGVLRDIGVDEVLGAIEHSQPNLEPDLVLVLDAPEPIGAFSFSSSDSFERDGLSSWREIRTTYLELSQRFGWTVIEADRNESHVTKDLITAIINHLKTKMLLEQ